MSDSSLRTDAQPFLKWAGGKRQLIPTIRKMLPTGILDGSITRYIEPFVGGGAVFFFVKQHLPLKSFYISDDNPDLINAYVVIRDSPEALLEELSRLAGRYLPLGAEDRSESFYRIRDEYNATRSDDSYSSKTDANVARAAQTIFLNRTCFNGLYRVNSNGNYNVPHGRYKSPKICDEINIRLVSCALDGVEVSCSSYENCESVTDKRTFIYFDPPYRPLPNTPSFTAYSKTSSFGDNDQRRLADFFTLLHDQHAMLMLSNSDPRVTDKEDSFFDALYSKFNICRVEANRAINSDATGRGAITEILVTNYSQENG
jgi:DNA adenine methylase